MVDVKISALSTISAVAAEDLIAIIDDPSGTPASRKATFTQILAFIDANSAGLNNVVEDTTPQLGADLECQGSNIQEAGVIFLKEQADADADVAGEGQIWVDTATPNVLYFTDDAGTDFRLNFNTSAQLLAMLSDETGTGSAVFATSPTLVTPALGTPASGVLDNCTSTSMVLTTPVLGTPTSGTLTNCTIPANGITYDINAQTGTTYTFVLGDAGDIVTSSNASAVTMTIPPNSSVAFPVGSSITVISIGAGLTSVTEGAGVLINSTGADPDVPVIRAQHSSATFIKTATDTWQAVGDIA